MASSFLARMAVIIDGQTAQFNKAMAQSQNQLASFTGGLKSVGVALLGTFGAVQIFNGLKEAVGIMADFEKTMSEVKAITGATGAEFDKLQADALRLGAATKYTSQQVGQLQVAYGRLGFNTQEILAATEATLDLAAATGEDLAKSADVAGSTVRGFGLEARETQRVVDVMAASFNETALGLDNFAESMKYVAPIAEAANVSVEETTALLGVLADAGIRGSSAGTALRKIFGDLSKDGRPVSERLDELGKKGIGLSDAFDEVGRTAQTALLVLTKNREKADELTRSFSNVEGEAAKMARTMQDNLAGDVEKLSSAWEGLILSLSKLGALRDATQALTAFVSALSGGSGDVVSGLDQLARGVKEGVTESNGGFQLLLEKIKEIRRETGKPIDTGIAQELADKYKLTEEQANVLYRAILDINKALSFQETAIKQFNEFVSRNGYEDLAKAADDYKNRLYELIVAEQIQKEQLKRTGQPTIEADKTIADYRKVIDIVNEYVTASVTGEEKVQQATEATVINLKFYQNALKNVNEAFESLALSQDASGRFTEKTLSGLRILAAESVGLEDFIKRVNRLKESFRDVDVIIKPPDITPLLENVKIIEETAGALTFETQVTEMEAITLRFEEEMAKRAESAVKHTETIKSAFIDLGAPIGSALSGIGEALGNSIAGVGDFGKDILKVVAGFARQLGEILISTGVAMLAAKKLITNPYTAIAAGIALVAIASAASAAINKSHSSTVGGSTGSTASRTATESTRSISASATEAQDVKVTGNAVIKGQDLYVIFQNYENNNRFTKANG
jgi:hypothetical protein